MSNGFEDVWSRRKDIEPEPMKDWVHNDWANGRDKYLTFLVKVEDEEIIKKVIDVQEELSDFSCVDTLPTDYFHITVKQGGFLVKSKESEDEIEAGDKEEIILQAEEILEDWNKFEANFSKLNLFGDVVFFEVHDKDNLKKLNKEFKDISQLKNFKFDYPNFLPHFSIAQFKNSQEFTELVDYLEKIRDKKLGTFEVKSIDLVIAHLRKKYPKLESIHTFNL